MGRRRLEDSHLRRLSRNRYARSKQLWFVAQARFDHETGAQVQRFASEYHQSIGEAIRTLVQWGLEEHRHGEEL